MLYNVFLHYFTILKMLLMRAILRQKFVFYGTREKVWENFIFNPLTAENRYSSFKARFNVIRLRCHEWSVFLHLVTLFCQNRFCNPHFQTDCCDLCSDSLITQLWHSWHYKIWHSWHSNVVLVALQCGTAAHSKWNCDNVALLRWKCGLLVI